MMIAAELFAEAEAVRWRMADIPFADLRRDMVSPGLLLLVQEIARSELTTLSATRRFLQEFADDVDFTQWISVWFYEESKHPQALLRWLGELGVHLDDAEILRGRVTTPFVKSRTATFALNIMSEMTASAGYLSLSRRCPEPVLAAITRRLAGDEARHAASFYRYARREIDRAREPELERRAALKALHLWLADQAAHPVSLFHDHARATPELERELTTDMPALTRRVCRMIGNLVGVELSAPADVTAQLSAPLEG